jgi:hypothetical protein
VLIANTDATVDAPAADPKPSQGLGDGGPERGAMNLKVARVHFGNVPSMM